MGPRAGAPPTALLPAAQSPLELDLRAPDARGEGVRRSAWSDQETGVAMWACGQQQWPGRPAAAQERKERGGGRDGPGERLSSFQSRAGNAQQRFAPWDPSEAARYCGTRAAARTAPPRLRQPPPALQRCITFREPGLFPAHSVQAVCRRCTGGRGARPSAIAHLLQLHGVFTSCIGPSASPDAFTCTSDGPNHCTRRRPRAQTAAPRFRHRARAADVWAAGLRLRLRGLR